MDNDDHDNDDDDDHDNDDDDNDDDDNDIVSMIGDGAECSDDVI